MHKAKKFLDKYWWLVLTILAIPAFWALLIPGFYGASDDLHIGWLYEMHRSFLAGKIPPRFVPDLSFGFGYPLFNFVFPLPFYIAEVFHLMGLSLVDSVKAVFLISIPVSGIFMYLFLRQFVNVWLSLSGAIVYIYTPYRAVDVYVRGAIGEIISFVFLPLILLSIIKILQGRGMRWIGIGALSLASLALSHNITAYMSFPFIFLFAAMMVFFTNSQKIRVAVNLFLTFFLGLLISAYFWLPALMESKLIKYDTVFNFADHFPTIRQLITPYFGYGASVPGPGDGMSFFLGVANILVLILGISSLLLKFKKYSINERVILIWSLISLMAAVFLMNYRSSLIWQSVPLLPYFQFPWRFAVMTSLCIPPLVISLKYFKLSSVVAILVILLTMTTSANYFKPQDFLGRGDDYYINRYIPSPVASIEYLTIQEEYLRLPTYTKIRPDRNYPLVVFEDGQIKNLLRINDLDAYLEVISESGSRLDYNKYFFPGWNVKVDGEAAEIKAGEPFGQITIQVPPGSHQVEIVFRETPPKIFLDSISLLSFILALLLALKIDLFNRVKSGKIRGDRQI